MFVYANFHPNKTRYNIILIDIQIFKKERGRGEWGGPSWEGMFKDPPISELNTRFTTVPVYITSKKLCFILFLMRFFIKSE